MHVASQVMSIETSTAIVHVKYILPIQFRTRCDLLRPTENKVMEQ